MKHLFVLLILFIANAVFAVNSDVDSVLRKFDFTLTEKKAIIAIFNDANEKGLDRTELIDILNEERIKNASFYETVEYLARKEKEIYEVKKSGFPYLENKEIKYIAYYFIGIYSVKQFNGLTQLIKEKKLPVKAIEDLFQFHLSLISYDVTLNDSLSILLYLLRNGYFEKTYLDSISGLYLRSKDLKMDRKSITRDLIGGLSRNQVLKNIIFEIKKKNKK